MEEIRRDDSARGSGLPTHFEIMDGELLELGIGAAQRKLRHPSPGAIIQLRSDEPFMVSSAYLLRTVRNFWGIYGSERWMGGSKNQGKCGR